MAWQTRANTNGLEMLCTENGWAPSPTAKTLPSTLATQMPNRSGATRARAGM
jgi:hypothetical protein